MAELCEYILPAMGLDRRPFDSDPFWEGAMIERPIIFIDGAQLHYARLLRFSVEDGNGRSAAAVRVLLENGEDWVFISGNIKLGTIMVYDLDHTTPRGTAIILYMEDVAETRVQDAYEQAADLPDHPRCRGQTAGETTEEWVDDELRSLIAGIDESPRPSADTWIGEQ
jgi:hypothetical protein